MAFKKRRANGHKGYGAYTFVDKDPVIFQLQQFLGDTKLAKVASDGGPSATCMRNWFHGDTRRPQNATIEAAGRAMGYERTWRKIIRKAST